jgi:hypothetical protein
MAEVTIKLGRRARQPKDAYLAVTKPAFFTRKEILKAKPFERVTLIGRNFTGYLGRGNPGVAVLIDGKPLTGAQMNSRGDFQITFEMPPFAPGIHTIDAFGIQTTIEVLEATDLISQEQLQTIVTRDFKLMDDCHILFSDSRYRITPIKILKNYVKNSCVPLKKYVAEFFDCDNFALSLSGRFDYDKYPQGYAHGEIWVLLPNGGGHAVNCWCVLDSDKVKMVVVEPQNGQIYNFPADWQCFLVKI